MIARCGDSDGYLGIMVTEDIYRRRLSLNMICECMFRLTPRRSVLSGNLVKYCLLRSASAVPFPAFHCNFSYKYYHTFSSIP